MIVSKFGSFFAGLFFAVAAAGCSGDGTTNGTGGLPPGAGGADGSGGTALGVGGSGAHPAGGAANPGGGSAGVGGTPAAGGNSAGGSASGGEGGGGGGEPSTVIDYPATYEGADEDGAELWLRYPKLPDSSRLSAYQAAFVSVMKLTNSPTVDVAEAELLRGLSGLTGQAVGSFDEVAGGAVLLGHPDSPEIAGMGLSTDLSALGEEGYAVEVISNGARKVTAIVGNTDLGILYGAFALLRHLQSHGPVEGLKLSAAPKIRHRVLNHWDNLDRSVERGYAGQSLWDWNALPDQLSPRYEDYARANASIGINGTVLTNVNADAQVLTAQYLTKVQALADVFRPYGIRVYLTARFSAPIEIGGLSTADPEDAGVKQWWAQKIDEIYGLIPDFGGFLVKANSEGQPGPGDYNRTHAQGANLLAEPLASHGGHVMWRAFVYAEDSPVDRIREAYDEFAPLDGQFLGNVFVQPKNGPLDFQPREPFHPLFGAMPETPLALELQITKEYLGQDTHLAYLGPMYEEVLQADTFAEGEGSSVARVIDGSLNSHSQSAIAGVANIGSDTDWTGSQFNQANWYVYGRMAWNPDLSAEAVAEEWVRQTFSNDPAVVAPVVQMMMASREALVDYMTPLGLVHIMASEHHYGPGPWVSDLGRPEWNPVYYHKADAGGIGFDRTSSGSNAVEQYFEPVRSEFALRSSVPDEFLLFFHHVAWDEVTSSGRSVWEELVHRYSVGVDQVQWMRDAWASVEARVDAGRFADVSEFLQIQHYEARWWRDACLSYFGEVGGQQIPAGYAAPNNPASYYEGLTCPANRDKPRCPQIETGEPSPAVTP